MADYVLIRKSRNILSNVLHILLNVLLGCGSIGITLITGSWIPGLLLVLLSKWRVFAVQPRYWGVNIKSSLVDLIVGASFVIIAYCSGTTPMIIHAILAVLYTAWLIFLKPKSSDAAAEMQSLAAVFLGTTAATLCSASLNSVVITVAAFVIGYAAARHILVQSSESDFTLVTFLCGLISAEIAWICHSWLIVYQFEPTGVIIPQLSIILTVYAFAFCRVYKSLIKHDGELHPKEFAAPTVFSILIIAMIVVLFSNPSFHL